MGLREDVDRVAAEADFSGVVRVERDGVVELDLAYGLADRGHEHRRAPSTPASPSPAAAKGFTALTVMALVEDGLLRLDTPARELLGDDLPLIDDAVTVEHLLAHRSGIGDYLDEDVHPDPNDYVMPVPVQRLADHRWTTSRSSTASRNAGQPGEVFEYCNGGYVVLAVLAERASGTAFHELVEQRVCRPAGLTRTGFLRTDELPGDVALGYVTMDGVVRSNVFHLPVRGTGDGGISTTLDDVSAFWRALDAGVIVPPAVVGEMTRVRSVRRRAGVRTRLLAAPDARHRQPRGLRRRRLVPLGARPGSPARSHRDRQHHRRRVAGEPRCWATRSTTR